MKEELYDDIFEDKEEQIDFKASLFKYIIRWPWFVASVIVCMACAWIYLKQSTPAYNINASILIKDEKKGGMLGNEFSGLEDLGLLNPSKNIDNEIEILQSKSLIKDVVNELGLYIGYTASKGFKTVRPLRRIAYTCPLFSQRCRTARCTHVAHCRLSEKRTDRS